MKNTRFNPTANGLLHVGHLYLIYVNLHYAKVNGGQLIVRFDDDQQYWKDRLGVEKIAYYCDEIKRDMDALGIDCVYSYESEQREANEEFTKDLQELKDWFAFPQTFSIKNCDRPYPYTPYLTAIKVAQDWRENCGIIARGEDLISEHSLYCYFCTLLGIEIPTFYYVPKLMKTQFYGVITTDLSDVTKTEGTHKIRDLGFDGIEERLRKVCLTDPSGNWDYENIRKHPCI